MNTIIESESFFDFIKLRRITKGLSQDTLGQSAGVAKSYICLIENGELPTLTKLHDICVALDLSDDEGGVI